MTTTPASDTVVRRSLPTAALAAIGIGGCWAAVAVAETILGGLDALESEAMVADGRGRIITAGLLHIAGAFLLAIGLIGVAERAWRTVMGRTGVVLCALLAVCLGSFGMLHLLAVDLNDEALGMLLEFGVWGIPIMIVALPGLFLPVLLLAGLARSGDVPWWTVALAGVGAVGHLLPLGGPEATETVMHWVLAAGMMAAAAYLVRRPA